MNATGKLIATILATSVMFSVPSPAAVRAPEEVVRDATEELFQALDGCPQNMHQPERLTELVDRILLPHVDFSRMSRWVLGKHWKRLDAGQRSRFMKEFRLLLVHTYATAIDPASVTDIRYLPTRPGSKPGRVVVRTEIHLASGLALPIHYYMHNEPGNWLVYDVRFEGISLLANYRTDFASEIEKRGSARAMIDALSSKNRADSVALAASHQGDETAGSC